MGFQVHIGLPGRAGASRRLSGAGPCACSQSEASHGHCPGTGNGGPVRIGVGAGPSVGSQSAPDPGQAVQGGAHGGRLARRNRGQENAHSGGGCGCKGVPACPRRVSSTFQAGRGGPGCGSFERRPFQPGQGCVHGGALRPLTGGTSDEQPCKGRNQSPPGSSRMRRRRRAAPESRPAVPSAQRRA